MTNNLIHSLSNSIDWQNLTDLGGLGYICSYCSNRVSSSKGYKCMKNDDTGETPTTYCWRKIYICPHCKKPTYIDEVENQFPGVIIGNNVNYLPKDVEGLYQEARNCISVAAYTASTLCCRKILMNIAVDLGAEEGENFIDYIKYLKDKNFVPQEANEVLQHIRLKGNNATHKIEIIEKEDAENLIEYIEILLKFVYEFPGKIKAQKNSEASTTPTNS